MTRSVRLSVGRSVCLPKFKVSIPMLLSEHLFVFEVQNNVYNFEFCYFFSPNLFDSISIFACFLSHCTLYKLEKPYDISVKCMKQLARLQTPELLFSTWARIWVSLLKGFAINYCQSVCHNILKEREVPLPCSYRSTCLAFYLMKIIPKYNKFTISFIFECAILKPNQGVVHGHFNSVVYVLMEYLAVTYVNVYKTKSFENL